MLIHDRTSLNLKNQMINSNSLDGSAIADCTSNLVPHERLQLLLGGLSLPFDSLTNTLITGFVSSSLGKICKTPTEIFNASTGGPMISSKMIFVNIYLMLLFIIILAYCIYISRILCNFM